jgi:GDSL-like Lipase/Acylhydrolase family
MRSSACLIVFVLAGCSGGCDGERTKPPITPKQPLADADATPGVVDPREPIPSGLLDAPAGSLEQLFRGLAAAEKQQTNGRVLLTFFGDSHTAGDSMTSRIRQTFQSRFGDAGRGLVAAGRPPAKHYYQRDVRYGATGVWKAAVGGHRDPEPFGIVGLRVYGEKKGASLWVETCADCPAGKTVAQFEILYLAAPDRGGLRYRVDEGAWQPLPTKTQAVEAPHPAREVIPVPDAAHKLTLEHTGGGMVDLFGVVLERNRPGVVVDSLGVVGRRLGSLRSWDWSIIGEQLAVRDPRLVVLQYGTNESDDPELDLEALARYYDETILRIRAAAPTASILILGPPDVAVREMGKRCDKLKPNPSGSTVTARTPSGSAAILPECTWRTPNVLREIIAVEHAAAVRNKVVFFDTFAAMGGGDKMDGWFLTEPKLSYKDRVHFTDLGYQTWADALSGALLAEYDRWRRTQP